MFTICFKYYEMFDFISSKHIKPVVPMLPGHFCRQTRSLKTRILFLVNMVACCLFLEQFLDFNTYQRYLTYSTFVKYLSRGVYHRQHQCMVSLPVNVHCLIVFQDSLLVLQGHAEVFSLGLCLDIIYFSIWPGEKGFSGIFEL